MRPTEGAASFLEPVQVNLFFILQSPLPAMQAFGFFRMCMREFNMWSLCLTIAQPAPPVPASTTQKGAVSFSEPFQFHLFHFSIGVFPSTCDASILYTCDCVCDFNWCHIIMMNFPSPPPICTHTTTTTILRADLSFRYNNIVHYPLSTGTRSLCLDFANLHSLSTIASTGGATGAAMEAE